MEKFEDILVNYFGATQPIFDNTTGGLTLSGEKAYKKLKALINKLGAVKVLDKNNVLEALKKIVETHILISQFNLSSELNGLRLAVIGKTLFTYDSWNGSSMTIVVDGIEILMKVQNRSAKILDTRNRFSSLLLVGDAQRRGRPKPPPRENR